MIARINSLTERIGRRPWIFVSFICVLQLAALLPLVGQGSFILEHIFRPYAVQILDGHSPYSALHYEYPPGSIPLILLPALLSNSVAGFRIAFDLWMIFWELAIVVMLGLLFSDQPRRLVNTLVIYSVSLLALGSLSLERFDLVPAALTLAAVAIAYRARKDSARSGLSWGLNLGIGAATKVWPLAVLPALIRRERFKSWALLGVIVPIIVSLIALWIVSGEEPVSAIKYHTERKLQIETLAATPFLVGAKLGAKVSPHFGSGSFNINGPGTELARSLTIGLLVAGYLALALMVFIRKTPLLLAATVLVSWTVLAAPVFSPQFVFWFLPLAAAALALRWEALILILTCALTRLTMEHYNEIPSLGSSFVWSVTARNLVFLIWMVLIVRLAWRRQQEPNILFLKDN